MRSAFIDGPTGIWIHVASPVSRDAHNQATYGTRRKIRAKKERKRQATTSNGGLIIETRTVIYSHDEIGENDCIWLPGEDDTDPRKGHLSFKLDVLTSFSDGTTLYKATL